MHVLSPLADSGSSSYTRCHRSQILGAPHALAVTVHRFWELLIHALLPLASDLSPVSSHCTLHTLHTRRLV
jgi:hypothetical protein